MRKILREFEPGDMKEFEPEVKVGLLATINPEGLPHVTLITALQARTPAELIWGQFTEGLSKKNVKTNPNTGFLIMTLKRDLWRGKARWIHEEKEGREYEMFNKKPMFRYNAYTGIHTVHYMDLVETYGREKLPLGSVILASLATRAIKATLASKRGDTILKPWAEGLFNRLNALKFLSYVDDDGFPCIIPILQCQAADSTRLVFSSLAYSQELSRVPEGSKVAVFALSLDMEDVLVRGTYRKGGKRMGVTPGMVDIDWVYNSMPPKQGQVYPMEELRPVREFRV